MRTEGRQTHVGATFTLLMCLLAYVSMHGWLLAAERSLGPVPVVILNSGGSTSLASQQLEQTIRHELAHADVGAVELFHEVLDAYSLAGGGPANLDADLKEFLTRKYQVRPPRLVVALGPPAIDFVQRHRNDLWSDARVIFAGLPLSHGMAKEDLGFPGVAFRTDAVRTMKLARQLVPTAKRVVIVSGASDYDRGVARVTERELADSGLGLERVPLSGLPPEELFTAVKALPPETVILYTTVFRDRNGQTFSSRELLERLSQVTSVPVFTLFENYLGIGPTGGAVTSWREHSLEAARLAVRALNSEGPLENTMTVSGRIGCVLDSRSLKRWNIDSGLVPRECELRFAPPSFWEAYRWWISSGVALGLLLIAIGGLLLVQLQRRRRSDESLQQQRDELAHAARLAMIGELTASIAHEINQPLGAILNNADAAEMILEANPQRTEEVKRILADIRRDDLRASEVIRHIRGLLRKSSMEVQRVALNDVVADVMRLIGADAERRGVTVTNDLARDLPDVLADAVHLRQVVLNLVLNAMDAMKQFQPDGRRVNVRTARDRDNIVVAVADRGPGIDPGRLDRIFDSFYTTKSDGLGLGLSIARYLVEANHGRLWAENVKGGGAVFQFSLPAVPATRAITSEVESAA